VKIGIIGGTFNPIHNAHLLIASLAREEYKLDKVIFMTGGNTPHKETSGADAFQRLDMVTKAVSDNPYFESSAFEIEKEGYSYTVETLSYLHKSYPDALLYFIVGSDSLDYMDKWYECEKIFSMCNVLVFERIGFSDIDEKIQELESRFDCRIEKIEAPIVEISSSMIRERVKQGKTIKYIVPDCVMDYIKEKGLYE
jgi:nicotinate-nucleotide adenylyltransferase